MQVPPPEYGADVEDESGLECLTTCCANFLCCICPIYWCSAFKIVMEFQSAVLFTHGKVRDDSVPPGLHCINPLIQELELVDYRTQAMDVASQQVMTKDAVTVTIDCVIYIRVLDGLKAILEVQDYDRSSNLDFHHPKGNRLILSIRTCI